MPRVLVACEMSGRVRTAFAARGWDAWSADLLPDEAHIWSSPREHAPGYHYQGDVMDIIGDDWDLVIAHPPCTDLSQAGARYWREKQADGRQLAAFKFFFAMITQPRERAYVAVENPAGIMSSAFRRPDQVVQPFMFGDPLRKKTCLWYREAWIPGKFTRDLRLDSLPHLVADNPVTPTGRVATGGGSWRTDKANGKTGMNNWEDSQGRARRHILRSLTPEGFARAASEQWGGYIEDKRS